MGTTRFVRPTFVSNTTYLLSSADLESGSNGGSSVPAKIVVESTFFHDKQGNPKETIVTTAQGYESNLKTIVNVYGTSNSAEERLGKVTLSTVTTQRTFPADCLAIPITHITQFEYGQVSRFASPVSAA